MSPACRALPAFLAALAMAGCRASETVTDDSEPPPLAVQEGRQAADEAKPGECSFGGWVRDEDPAGTNLRAGPGTQFEVVAVLPRYKDDVGGLAGIEAPDFDIVEARDGWFRLANVQYLPLDAAQPSDRKSYPDGWIHGSKVDFALQTEFAFARPDSASPVVASGWYEDDVHYQMPHRSPSDCRGEWVKLEVAGHDGRWRSGWARGVCHIYETSCDGVSGDGEQPGRLLPRYD